MSGELLRRVSSLTVGIVAAIAAVAWLVVGAQQGAGAIVGGVLTLGNFLWLRWAAGVALHGGEGTEPARPRRLFWLAASSARFGIMALALGLAVTQTGVGLGGLLASLPALPIAVVAAALPVTRAA